MLRPVSSSVSSGAAVVACSTCRLSAETRDDAEGLRGGARLVAALREVKAADPRYDGVAVQEMACLFACKDHCTVHLRAPGKISYVLGRFAPDLAAARAILDYAVHYAASAQGEVPYADWPEGIKGHFITRSPPEGFVAD
jgi:predicted metal-binding protein